MWSDKLDIKDACADLYNELYLIRVFTYTLGIPTIPCEIYLQ